MGGMKKSTPLIEGLNIHDFLNFLPPLSQTRAHLTYDSIVVIDSVCSKSEIEIELPCTVG